MNMIDSTFLIAVAAAVLGAASMVLHVVAPRTKNTIDDKLRDDIDEVLAFIRQVGQAPAPVTTTPAAPSSPVALVKGAGPAVLLALVVVAIAAAGSLTACSGAGAVATDAKVSVVDCLRADATAIGGVVADLGTAALVAALTHGAIDWASIESASWAQGKTVGGCALAEFVAALGKAPGAQPGQPPVASLLAPPDPAADGRATLERFRARAGGVRWSTSAGVL